MVAHRLMLEQLVQLIAPVERPHPVRVAIDGIDAAGKPYSSRRVSRPDRRPGEVGNTRLV